ARFDGLRRAHSGERAPAALRRRVLARARATRSFKDRRGPRARGWLARGGLLGIAAGVAACLWLGVSLFVAESASERGGLAPPQLDVLPRAEPAGSRAAGGRCATRLPTSPWNPLDIDIGLRSSGFVGETFETATECGALTRRYVVWVPEGKDAASAPVLLVLHDAGENPSQVQLSTRWWFLDLAQREHLVLVYANGSSSMSQDNSVLINAGVWQADGDTHPAVDDSEYLKGIVEHLRLQRGLARSSKVFLAGYGSGAVMALAAAMQHPDRYAGVAAFLPTRLPAKDDFGSSLPAASSPSTLKSVFIALPEVPGADASELALRWASALGKEPGGVRVKRPQPGVQRIESRLAGGISLEMLRLSPRVDPFPVPGGGDPLTRRASKKNPSFFDGPGAAWALFRRPHP
ncbi:MAG TPA: hypothetical protein VJU61_20195, partial [Polyangiaceae bacterium]|nr:hypothetical protein [Polyangiaceae bacterium]